MRINLVPLVAVLVSLILLTGSSAFGGTSVWNSFNDVLVSSGNESSAQFEGHLSPRATNDNHFAAALMDFTDGAPECRAYSSSDGGQAWTDRGFLDLNFDTIESGDPVVASDASGNFFIVCLAIGPDWNPAEIVYWFSANGGSSWSGPNTISRVTGGLDVKYNDKPWIAADFKDPSSPFQGNVYVCWTQVDKTPLVDTVVIKFRKIWPSIGSIKQVASGDFATEDPSTGDIQFCQIAVGKSGIIYVTWQRLIDDVFAKIQLKRSFDGGNSFESTSQPVKTFERFPADLVDGGLCPMPNRWQPWGCLGGIGGSEIIAPAIHSIAIDKRDWYIHVAFSDYDNDATPSLADVKYTKGKNCITPNVTCSWSASQRIVKDGAVAKDQWDPAIAISPDTYTIHVTAMDRRDSLDNTEWEPWHYHCHITSTTSCESSTEWTVTSVTTESSWNLMGEARIGDYHGIASTASREANTIWTDSRLHLGNQDFNIFGDWTT